MELIAIDGVMVPHLIVPTTGDGSCFFNSLSYFMYGTDAMANNVRSSIVQHICKNWERFNMFSMMPNGNVFETVVDYMDYMSLPTSYATHSEIIAAGEIYPYHLVVYHNGNVIIQPEECVEGRPILRFRCSGPMMSSHFEPLIPQCFPAHQQLPTIASLLSVGLHNDGNLGDLIKSPKQPPFSDKKSGIKRRAKFTDREKRKKHALSVKKYNLKLPEVNQKAVQKYTKINPNVNREAVNKYSKINPNVHREAVIKYSKINPNVHQEAVIKYSKINPNVHREAVNKYSKINPEVNREAVKKYNMKNPEINQEAVRRYNEKKQMIIWKTKTLSAFKYNSNINYSEDKVVAIGEKCICKWCNAIKWKEESPGLCCRNGKVYLPPIQQAPDLLHSLLTNDHPESQHFLKNVRKYNGCFQMTSFGANEVREGKFMPTFKVQGQVYHSIGSLLPPPQQKPSFLQIYFVGNDEKESEIRSNIFSAVKPWLVLQLQKLLHNHNPYIRDFKTAVENAPEEGEFKVVIHADRKPSGEHKGRYNAPATTEVALVIVGQEFEKRDIVLHSRDTKLVRISETHRAYDALQYPLMFVRGEDGYTISLPQIDKNSKAPLQKTVSASDFYAYRIMERKGQNNYILLYKSLFNQYLVDMYAKIETERLNFIKQNQSKLRAENYVHLRDAMCKGDGNVSDIGKKVVLPSSFTGGPRYMHERTQDALTYVRQYGRPDLFITFTCNSKWTEIQEALNNKQKPSDRHDIIARIFHLKVKKIIHLLTKGSIFGQSRCYIYTVEWQKRGLPHVHILLWLQDRIMPSQIDSVISAEIPDAKSDPALHEIIRSTMIHGPCGNLNRKSPCMIDGSCTKRYPRPLNKNTQTAEDGYPQYRRRSQSDGGFTVNVNGVDLDNQWVVPYNPVLSRTFKAHINVELCNSVKSIKYICKYVNKGSDQASFGLENERNEVTKYETGRYISSSEAVWRILCFPIHERYPPVMHLSVHLENGQRVYFTENNAADKVQNPPKTTLLAFFELCRVDAFAKSLLYSEVPAYYVWKNNKFTRRKQGRVVCGHQGIKRDEVIGRVYTVHPNNTECYYLRLLLHEVRGPTCYEDLKNVSGVVHPTYQSACQSLGLLEDDTHWDLTLKEAIISDSPYKLRELFAIMLVYCQLADPLSLWENHKESLSEDIKWQTKIDFQGADIKHCRDIVYNECLVLLEKVVFSMSNKPLHQFGLPSPSKSLNEVRVNREYLREMSYDVAHLSQVVAQNLTKLNTEQHKAYREVISSIGSDSGHLFFLDAPGGTGKTFLINLLLASVRKNKKIAISVASSGIAATLLDGGKTAHSAFKLPLNLNLSETPVCNISKQSDTAQVLKECNLIVWDECTMAHKKGIEALDRTLQDIRSSKCLMGGMTVLLAGDFRQILPVVPRGTRADEVKASLKSSYLWPKVKIISLRVNMRVHLHGDSQAKEFSDLLLEIGDGKLKEEDGKVPIPEHLCEIVENLSDLCDKIYPDLVHSHFQDPNWLKERAILTPKNETTSNINDYLLEKLPTKMVKYKSVDSVVEIEDAVHYPVEFLHTLNPPGIPLHNLCLKIGAPIILLRNLMPPKLCNGTRLQVKCLHSNVIEATIFTGCGAGEAVFIPRIPLIPSDYHFQFKRMQFPVKVCFAMTINKAQGQSLKVAGVDLRNDCFSHGQFYVACSRVSSPRNLVILQPERRTKNIVYKEIL